MQGGLGSGFAVGFSRRRNRLRLIREWGHGDGNVRRDDPGAGWGAGYPEQDPSAFDEQNPDYQLHDPFEESPAERWFFRFRGSGGCITLPLVIGGVVVVIMSS